MHVHSFYLIVHKQKSGNSSPVYRSDGTTFSISAPDNPIEIHGRARSAPEVHDQSLMKEQGRLHLVSGDMPSSPQGEDTPECSAAAVQIDIDFFSRQVMVYGSLVGLPPVFYRESADRLIITSDIYYFTGIADSALYFDEESVRELSIIGYPIGGKTLFKGVKMLPAGHVLTAGGTRMDISLERYWALPSNQYQPPQREFLEQQSDAFLEAMRRIDISSSFLSLTAGMDTRTILAALTAENINIPAYTMSGPRLSLDARTAGKLCAAYNLEHDIIYLDAEFFDKLPHYSSEACRLSGGLAGLSQAHEVYFYSKVGKYTARLSGNLGNQVGRGGAENISLRNAGFLNFNPAIYPPADARDLRHWYTPYLRGGGHLSFDFLLEQEIPFSSVGNFCVGHNFAVQQSPYADKKLIEVSANRPIAQSDREKSMSAMRLKDLRHRFLGEPITTSFQRKLIKEIDGAVAEIPINWGGRAKGSVSLGGVAYGMMALADAALASRSIDGGPVYELAAFLGIAGVHEYRSYNRWLKGPLREFALDVFSSKDTKECGLFNIPALRENAHSYFFGGSNTYKSISLSLDLALAAKSFNARL
jgi:hypothetical protein